MTDQGMFWGRLYQAKTRRDPLNQDFTVEDMRRIKLKGTPVWIEHNGNGGSVGEIIDSWIDSRDNWVWVRGQLHSREMLGSRYDEIAKRLNTHDLRDLSIHWTGQTESRDSNVVDPDTRTIIEVSLCKKGAFEGTNLLSVAASRIGNSQQLHVHLPAQQDISLTPPSAMSQDYRALKDTAKQRGVDLTDQQINELLKHDPSGEEGSLILWNYIMDQVAAKTVKETANKQEEERVAALNEAEYEEYQRLKEFKEGHDAAYAKEQSIIKDEIFEFYKGRKASDEEREHYLKELTALSQRPELGTVWNQVKETARSDMENATALKETNKQLKAAQKQLEELRQAPPAAQTVEVQANERGRGVAKIASTLQKRDESPKRAGNQSTGKTITVEASARAAMANNYFPAAAHDMSDTLGQLCSSLAQQPLIAGELGVCYLANYTGYTETMPKDRPAHRPLSRR